MIGQLRLQTLQISRDQENSNDHGKQRKILTEPFHFAATRIVYQDITALILRWKKGNEYFIVRMYQDLIGDWVVSQSWGATNTGRYPSYRKTVLPNYDEARTMVREIRKQRKFQGFRLMARKEVQLGFSF